MRGAALKAWLNAGPFTTRRRRTGVNSPTGTPLRVTTKISPSSSRRMMSPLLLRNSRWLISVPTSPSVALVRRSGPAVDDRARFRPGAHGPCAPTPVGPLSPDLDIPAASIVESVNADRR